MIDQEMEQFEPEDYIASLPAVPPVSFGEESALAQEYQRIMADPSSSISAVDMTRYVPKAPSGKQASSDGAWTEAVARAQTMQEHQDLRLVNDGLMQQYSVNAWRAFNSGLEDRNELLKKELELEKIRVLDMNRCFIARAHAFCVLVCVCVELFRRFPTPCQTSGRWDATAHADILNPRTRNPRCQLL